VGEAKRRKAKIEQLKRDCPRGRARMVSITAIHEAGHAVSRFLTAATMGYEPQDALSHIEMHHPDTAAKYFGPDGKLFYDAAITFGPMFSKAIESISKPFDVKYGVEGIRGNLHEYCIEVTKAARAAGVNVDSWVKAKMIVSLAGPVAEAKATRKTLGELPQGWENDYEDACGTCAAAGMEPDQADILVDEATRLLETEFANPLLWNALLTLAAALPKEGTMEGHRCWQIFSDAYAPSSSHSST
jgi:hypothetical protein